MPDEYSTLISGLTEEKLAQLVNEDILASGKTYHNRRQLLIIIQSEHRITGLAQSSSGREYTINIPTEDFTSAHCTCSSTHNYCKHIVATLLNCIHRPETVQKIADLNLGSFTQPQLEKVIINLILAQPKLFNQLILSLEMVQKTSSTLTVSPDPYIQKAEYLLEKLDSYENQQEESDIIEELCDLIGEAKAFNDSKNTIIILRGLTEAYLDCWENSMGSYGFTGEFISYLDEAWAETILLADLNQEQKSDLSGDLQEWDNDAGYESFSKALLALEQGWHTEEITSILAGTLSQPREEQDYYPLAKIRIGILKKQRRFKECERLAHYAGLTVECIQALIWQGHTEEALKRTHKTIIYSKDILLIAQTLLSSNYQEESISCAQHGFTLKGDKTELANWLATTAISLGKLDIAQTAYLHAFEIASTLDRYHKLLTINPTLKNELINSLRHKEYRPYSQDERIDIFLQENLLDDAIDLVESQATLPASEVKLVMKTALPYKPGWVIEQVLARTKKVLREGSHKDYPEALAWLTLAKQAYESTQNISEWHHCLSRIKETHKTKKKLLSMLSSTFGEQETLYL